MERSSNKRGSDRANLWRSQRKPRFNLVDYDQWALLCYNIATKVEVSYILSNVFSCQGFKRTKRIGGSSCGNLWSTACECLIKRTGSFESFVSLSSSGLSRSLILSAIMSLVDQIKGSDATKGWINNWRVEGCDFSPLKCHSYCIPNNRAIQNAFTASFLKSKQI